MDPFEKNMMESKNEVRTVVGSIVILPIIALVIFGHLHLQTQDKAVERYLEQERPDILLAIEAFKADDGHFPDYLTNAVSRYYKGRQQQVFFLESYGYKNYGTNFFLKDFHPSGLGELTASYFLRVLCVRHSATVFDFIAPFL
jgi:hypothetical protein